MRVTIVVLVAAALLGTPAVQAQSVSPRQQAADLAGQLMSPFCPGRLLVDCTSSQAYDLRETISRRLAAGESVAAVRADLVREYGAAILGAPAPEGIGLLAWFGPALLGLATFAAVTWKVMRAARAGAAPPLVPAAAGDARVLTQLDDELRDLD